MSTTTLNRTLCVVRAEQIKSTIEWLIMPVSIKKNIP